MSVLVFIENNHGKIKKSGLEAITYAAQFANKINTDCVALTYGKLDNENEPGKYGARKLFVADYAGDFDNSVISDMIIKAAEMAQASYVIMAHTANAKSCAGTVAVKLQAAIVTAVNALPETEQGVAVRKSVFSGKANAWYKINSTKGVFTLAGNSIQPQETGGNVEILSLEWQAPALQVKVLERKTAEGIVPLPEAELVVSAGRGMKGPENWGIIEELAKALNATTACSRPVADTGWRPHHEHVGQTGVAIKPNLYIAVGISGAIQHLAGVNNSKTIVVINKDPEAPFFKAADYGVVGDLFEVVPKLTEAVKKFKASHG